MDSWTKAGTIAAVVAAIAATIGVLVSWWYGRRSVGESHKAVTYDRFREARELVGTIWVNGGNTRWTECNEACAQLRAVVVATDVALPRTQKLAETQWNLDSYTDVGLEKHVRAAREELEQATRQLLD